VSFLFIWSIISQSVYSKIHQHLLFRQSESNVTFTERGLNQEIERMIQETTLQKRKIAELESQLTSRVTRLGKMPDKTQKKVQPEKRPKSKSPTSAPKDQRSDSTLRHTSPEKVRSSFSIYNIYYTSVKLLGM
jgi:hypothetical protein